MVFVWCSFLLEKKKKENNRRITFFSLSKDFRRNAYSDSVFCNWTNETFCPCSGQRSRIGGKSYQSTFVHRPCVLVFRTLHLNSETASILLYDVERVIYKWTMQVKARPGSMLYLDLFLLSLLGYRGLGTVAFNHNLSSGIIIIDPSL